MDMAKKIVELSCVNNYGEKDLSYSPFFSDIGLGFESDIIGISNLFLHYNRKTTTIPKMGINIPCDSCSLETGMLSVTQHGKASAVYSFFSHNAFIISLKNVSAIFLDFDKLEQLMQLRTERENNKIYYDCYVKNIDERDPDEFVPVAIGINIISGELSRDSKSINSQKDNIYLAVHVQILDINREKMQKTISDYPKTVEQAQELTLNWLSEYTKLFKTDFTEQNAPIIIKAITTLLFNSTISPGKLSNHISCFPSRGGYPTHFLWDACFQNLGLELLNIELAKDSILQLVDNIRCDGRIPHFVCSTWERPTYSQPPLVGWAALRLIKLTKDLDFAKYILPKLVQNINWWTTQRMSKFGLIFTTHALETGWDNSPRFDKGNIITLDINSYLILQIDACVEIANMIGDASMSETMRTLSTTLCKNLFNLLYDAQENIFYDLHLESGEKIKIKTPASFMPLLLNVPLVINKKKDMIESYLLNEKFFNGRIPLPSNAYSEPTYDAANWWRGPMWLPVAYIMLEILQKYGYIEKRKEIAYKLYNIVVKEANLSELFNSMTGQGMGCKQQGWTAGVFLRLCNEYPEFCSM